MNFKIFRKNLVFILCIVTCFPVFGQYKISGEVKAQIGDKIKLMSYNGFSISAIDSTVVDNKGLFELHYSDNTIGMSYLMLMIQSHILLY
jgi:hypothetical protein